MRYLALLLELPLFAIFVWLYLVTPRGQARPPRRYLYDACAIALALAASIAVMLYAYDTGVGRTGLIWKQVAAVLAAFHVFPLILVSAWLLRKKFFRP